MINQVRKLAGLGAMAVCLLWAGLILGGCGTAPDLNPIPGYSYSGSSTNTPRRGGEKFQIGDQVGILYKGVGSAEPIPAHQETVKEDGTITPPFVGSVVAAGKTPGELQRELQEKYDTIFKDLNVTVVAPNRYYYVSGEVRKPGPQPYLGETDIIKAISSAGDFTEFANKHNVRLTRGSGQTQVINVQKIFNNQGLNVPVYPGDTIMVKRRWL